MPTWKKLLASATTARTLARARQCTNQKTVYKLGKGGMDPTKPMPPSCDCSGFVSWALGVPRELPPGSDRWLQTDTFHSGGDPVGKNLFLGVPAGNAMPGDIYVYPDANGHQGHVGIVSEVAGGVPTKMFHCSMGNYTQYDDAILETKPDVIANNPHSRLVRTDFAALRALFGVVESSGGSNVPASATATVPAPSPEGVILVAQPLLHDELSGEESLRLVAQRQLVLEETGGFVAGIGAIQDVLNRLAALGSPRYAVDWGANQRYRGFFGSETAKALRAFQADHGLPSDGDVDLRTLLALDRTLSETNFREATDHARDVEKSEVVFTLRQDGRNWYAKADGGTEFLVGYETKYSYDDGVITRGLANDGVKSAHKYKPDSPEAASFGHWAWMVYPSSLCESGALMNCINTYDKAWFTFGFFQFAAHVENGDFVRFFRTLVGSNASAASYFPRLKLNSAGHICEEIGDVLKELENKTSSLALAKYLNPTYTAIEEREVLMAARLMHWCDQDAEMRKAQIAEAVNTAREKLVDEYPLSRFQKTKHANPLDTVCLLVMDLIHNRGLGKVGAKIDAILKDNSDPDKAVAQMIDISLSGRRDDLRTTIASLKKKGILGTKRYTDFVNE